jgi:hypothetical protein
MAHELRSSIAEEVPAAGRDEGEEVPELLAVVRGHAHVDHRRTLWASKILGADDGDGRSGHGYRMSRLRGRRRGPPSLRRWDASTARLHNNATDSSTNAADKDIVTLDMAVFDRIGIRCNAVAPGLVLTPAVAGLAPEQREASLRLYPMPRLCAPEDVANVVLFLASEEAAYVNGATVMVDGGATVYMPSIQAEPPANGWLPKQFTQALTACRACRRIREKAAVLASSRSRVRRGSGMSDERYLRRSGLVASVRRQVVST